MECKQYSQHRLCPTCRARYAKIVDSLTALCALFKGAQRDRRKDRGWRSAPGSVTKRGSVKTIYCVRKAPPTTNINA